MEGRNFYADAFERNIRLFVCIGCPAVWASHGHSAFFLTGAPCALVGCCPCSTSRSATSASVPTGSTIWVTD